MTDISSVKFTKEELMDMAIETCKARESIYDNTIERFKKEIACCKEEIESKERRFSEFEILAFDCIKQRDVAIAALLSDKQLLKEQLRKLLNKVNRVTSKWRHVGGADPQDLDALSNRQIEVEEATKGKI